MKVLVTRPRERSGALCDLLGAAGLEAVCLPVIETQPVADLSPLDAALRRVATYDWVVVSSSMAAHLVGKSAAALGLAGSQWPAQGGRPCIVAGPAGAAELARYGLSAEVVRPFSAGRTLDALHARLCAGQRALLPRGDQGLDTLARGLRERGLFVDEVVVYTTRPSEAAGSNRTAGAAHLEGVAAVTFLSPSAVGGLDGAFTDGPELDRLKREGLAACIGPTTAAAARTAGWQRIACPEDTSAAALAQTVAAALAREAVAC